MSNEEFIEWFKKYTALTKKDNELAETVGLELNVEISVEMAEQLISLIEKQQKEIEKLRIKNGKEFVRGMETNEKLWQAKIENKIETIQNETWYVDGSAEARQACIDELMSL